MKNIIKCFVPQTVLAVLLILLTTAQVTVMATENTDNEVDLSLVMTPETQLTVYVDGKWSDSLSGEYGFGDTATITAPAKSGSKTFSHWEADGSVISYDNPLKISMNAHTTLYAVYADTAKNKQPVSGFTSITRTNDGDKISFQAIAGGGDVATAGIVYSTTASGESLKIGGTGVTNVEAKKLTDETTQMPESVLDENNCWILQITPEDGSTVYHARTYVTVGDKTTYGDVKDVKISDVKSGVSLIADPDGFAPSEDDIKSLLGDVKVCFVTFDANGGEGVMDPQGVIAGEETALDKNTFTRENYVFAGWNTKADGSGTAYTDGQKVTLDAETTLYAQWKNPADETQKPEVSKGTADKKSDTPVTPEDKKPATDSISDEEKADAKIALNSGLKVSFTGKKITVKWGKVEKADRYEVYAAYCGTDKYKKIKTLSGGKRKYTFKKLGGKKLNTKKHVKVYVVAYRKADGKETKITKSLVAHVVGPDNEKSTNVKKIKLSENKYTLSVNKTVKIKAKTVLKDKKKKKISDGHAPDFRYASADTKVATVDSDGKIKAVGKGTCYVYVYAKNGYPKKIKVTVK